MVSAPRADDQCDYCFVDCCYKYCDQDSHTARKSRPSSIKKQKRRLERDLGRPLMSTPPRT